MPTMPSSMSSRNPVGAVHQPSGSLPGARFAANNLPASLAQISHGGLHGQGGMGSSRSGLTSGISSAYSSSLNATVPSVSGTSPNSAAVSNRAAVPGLGVSPSMIAGGAGPRITNTASSMISGALGGGLGRTMNPGAGLSIPSYSTPRLGSNVSGLGMQGPGRPSSNVLQQASPQMVSLLGSNFSNSLGSIAQRQVTTGNGQLSSMTLMNEAPSNDGAAFDLNDFPQLSTGGSQGSIASLRKQVGVNPIVQQSQEFSIQNENFPALPGFKGGNNDFTPDLLQQKDSQLENAFTAVPSQQYAIGRSSGISLGGSFVPHRQQQQPLQHEGQPSIPPGSAPGSFSARSASDLLQMHSSADAFQAQVGGPSVASSSHVPISSLRSTGNPMIPYDQLAQQYQQQHNPSQFRLGAHQQLAAMSQLTREQGSWGLTTDRFGLLGLLNVIRMSNHDLTTLALGTDLTTLGLDLNARDNLYKRFASPWAEGPAKGEPEFTLPQCYVHEAPLLQPGYFTKFQQATLFYIFYSMPNDEAQLYAANELYNRGWFYHKQLRTWLARVPNMEPLVTTPTYERGSYYYFDANTWELARKDHFVVHYDMMEKRPELPQH